MEILSSETAKWAWVAAELLTEKVSSNFDSICIVKICSHVQLEMISIIPNIQISSVYQIPTCKEVEKYANDCQDCCSNREQCWARVRFLYRRTNLRPNATVGLTDVKPKRVFPIRQRFNRGLIQGQLQIGRNVCCKACSRLKRCSASPRWERTGKNAKLVEIVSFTP